MAEKGSKKEREPTIDFPLEEVDFDTEAGIDLPDGAPTEPPPPGGPPSERPAPHRPSRAPSLPPPLPRTASKISKPPSGNFGQGGTRPISVPPAPKTPAGKSESAPTGARLGRSLPPYLPKKPGELRAPSERSTLKLKPTKLPRPSRPPAPARPSRPPGTKPASGSAKPASRPESATTGGSTRASTAGSGTRVAGSSSRGTTDAGAAPEARQTSSVRPARSTPQRTSRAVSKAATPAADTAEITARVKKLERAAADSSEAHRGLRDKLAGVESRLTLLSEQVSEQPLSAESTVEELRKNLETLKAEVASLLGTRSVQLDERLEHVADRIDSKTFALSELDTRLANIESRLRSLEEDDTEAFTTLTERVDELAGQLATAISELRVELVEAQKGLAEVNEVLAGPSVTTTFQDFGSQVDKIAASVAEQTSALHKRLDAVEEVAHNRDPRIDILETKLDEHASQPPPDIDWGDRLTALEQRIESQQRELDGAAERNEQMRATVEEQRTALDRLGRLNGELQERLERMEHSVASPPSSARILAAGQLQPTDAAMVSQGFETLTRVKGIGPKFARALVAEGVTSSREIAAWSDMEIERLAGVVGASVKRLTSWRNAAKKLG